MRAGEEDELVELLEAAVVEQELEALARGELVAAMLRIDAGLATFPTVERAAWALSQWASYWEQRAGT